MSSARPPPPGPGAAGSAHLRRFLEQVEPATESPQETRLRLALVAGGLPRPVAQHVVRTTQGRVVARVDLAYPELRVAVEYDGRASHPLGLARDRDRAWGLQRAGWLVVHVTAELLRRREELCRRVEEARQTRRSTFADLQE